MNPKPLTFIGPMSESRYRVILGDRSLDLKGKIAERAKEMHQSLAAAIAEVIAKEDEKKKQSPAPLNTPEEWLAWLNKTYNDTGGVTPELRRAFQFYLENYKGPK